MSKGESARVHEQNARAELIQRISLRDNTLVLYLGTIGALLGLTKNDTIGTAFLLIIPFLAFGATIIIEQHHIMIGLLGYYLAVELNKEYKGINEFVPQWDGSFTITHRKSFGKYPWLLQRRVGHVILITLPAVLSLIINYKYFFPEDVISIAWWVGSIFTFVSILTIFQTSKYRKELYDHYPEEQPPSEHKN